MELWLALFIGVGIVIPIIGKLYYKHEYTTSEIATVIVLNTVVSLMIYGGGRYSTVADVELHNGYVTAKHQDRVGCVHTYPCNPRTVSCGDGCETVVYETCNEHPYDWAWVVETTVGNLRIDRIDRRGVQEPPRFSQVVIGEPASSEHTFVNYIKAAPDSLFNKSILDDETIEVPKYPYVFDYYRVDRVLNPDGLDLDTETLNDLLSASLSTMGHEKKVNIIVLVTSKDEGYGRIVEARWLGGKQNDVVVVIGMHEKEIAWTHSFGFSENSMVYEVIKNDIRELKVFSVADVHAVIVEGVNKYFIRKDMEEYAYLADQVDPPLWSIIMGLLFSIIGTTIATIVLSRNHVRDYRRK